MKLLKILTIGLIAQGFISSANAAGNPYNPYNPHPPVDTAIGGLGDTLIFAGLALYVVSLGFIFVSKQIKGRINQ
jgi:hypothetical protein